MTAQILRCLAGALLLLAASFASAAEIEDFAFIQISDAHISPHLTRMGAPGPVRGAESIAWITQHARGPQQAPDLGLQAPAPAFTVATGDLTEFGVIDDTWDVFRNAFAGVPQPLYVTPGNHDNTWVAMFHIMRAEYGGTNYSVDKHGCHFVFLNSATAQEPVPSIDATTRAWLEADLAQVTPGTPIFLAFHHPIAGGGLANPAEYDTFTDMLRNHNVALIMYGHGHSVNHRNMDGLDGVMGGSTYGGNAGYAVYNIKDGTLQMAYHYHRKPGREGGEKKPGWKQILQKPIAFQRPERLFDLYADAAQQNDVVAGPFLPVRLKPKSPQARITKVQMHINGEEVSAESTHTDLTQWRTPTDKLAPGWHLLTVRAWVAGKDLHDIRTLRFRTAHDRAATIWRAKLPASVKARPVVVDGSIILARTDGVVSAHDRKTGQHVWTFSTGGEILATPRWIDGHLVFGSGDGHVYALDANGEQQWRQPIGLPVYGEAIARDGVVYVGDNGGRLHALDLATGQPQWSFERADYAIEARPVLFDDLVVFGAWDGYLYALDAETGEQRWKALGPKSSEGRGIRYYAPADCGPVVLGDTLFACDRGYHLGTYNAAGKQGEAVTQSIAGIAPCGEGRRLYARALTDFVACYDADGTERWKTEVPAGRFPVPPTVTARHVYVCSNNGTLNVLDASSGKLQWQYKVSPGFYVMAPVGVDADGVCYVVDMDGMVSALKPPIDTGVVQVPAVAR